MRACMQARVCVLLAPSAVPFAAPTALPLGLCGAIHRSTVCCGRMQRCEEDYEVKRRAAKGEVRQPT